MEIYNLTYLQFIALPEEFRNQYIEVYLCVEPQAIDCKTWSWGAVKEAQDLFSGDLTFKEILDIAEMAGKINIETVPAHVVFSIYNGIKKSITEISELESQQWASDLEIKQQIAMEQVGGFGRFGTLPQTLRLCEVLRMGYSDVVKIDWVVGYNSFTYDKVSTEYNSIILKQTSL